MLFVRCMSAFRTVIRTIFHFVNIGVSVMMAASAAFGFMAISSIDEIQEILLSIYLM